MGMFSVVCLLVGHHCTMESCRDTRTRGQSPSKQNHYHVCHDTDLTLPASHTPETPTQELGSAEEEAGTEANSLGLVLGVRILVYHAKTLDRISFKMPEIKHPNLSSSILLSKIAPNLHTANHDKIFNP